MILIIRIKKYLTRYRSIVSKLKTFPIALPPICPKPGETIIDRIPRLSHRR